MDGGIHALKDFIYQASVTLDMLLLHFEGHPGARARPEGADDLEFAWSENGRPRCEYIQIKKPREDDHGQLKREPWTLSNVAQVLLPDAIEHLRGNDHVQRWILGACGNREASKIDQFEQFQRVDAPKSEASVDRVEEGLP